MSTHTEHRDVSAEPRRMGAFWLLPAVAVLAFAGLFWRHRYFFHDDAYISLRYARNLLDHGELVWNAGERVEGYTNFLHLLAVAALGSLGVDLTTAALVVNGLSLAGLLLAVGWAFRVLVPNDGWAQGVGWLGVLTCGPLVLWTRGGLEAVMVAALVAGATVPLLRSTLPGPSRSAVSGLLFALAALTRPDAALLGGLAAGAVLVGGPWPVRARLRTAVLIIAPIAIFMLVHALWRHGYYGAWLPNTAAAKLGIPIPTRLATGTHYILGSLVAAPHLAVAAVAIAAWYWIRRRVGWPMVLLAVLLLGQTLYVLWVGGDHMEGARFFVPILPFTAFILALIVSAMPPTPPIRYTTLAAAFIVVALSLVVTESRRMDPAAFVGGIVGDYIAKTWPAGALVALHTAGSTPFYAPQLAFVDMLGLNDRTIAARKVGPPRLPMQELPGHLKGDGRYVLRRQPDFIIAGPAEGAAVEEPWFLSDVELAALPDFHRCYRKETTEIPYGDALARRGPRRPRPLVFTFYRRICPKAETTASPSTNSRR